MISRLLGFALRRSMIGWQKFAPFSLPVGSQTKTNRVLVASGFFRACRRLHVFASNFDWLIVLFISDMIIQSNYFGSGFGFTTLK